MVYEVLPYYCKRPYATHTPAEEGLAASLEKLQAAKDKVEGERDAEKEKVNAFWGEDEDI